MKIFENKKIFTTFGRFFKIKHRFGFPLINMISFIIKLHTMVILIVTLAVFLLVKSYPYLASYLTAATRR